MIKIITERWETIKKKLIQSPNTIPVVSLISLAVLMLLPFSMDKIDLVNHEHTSKLLYPFTVLFSDVVQKGFYFFYVSCFSFFLLPAVFIVTLLSFFQKKITRNIVCICSFIAVTLYLSTSISGCLLITSTHSSTAY